MRPLRASSNSLPQLILLIEKEVGVLKSKLIKVIYIALESSFSAKAPARTTRDLITLLKALDESKSVINERVLLSRAKFMKDFMQAQMVRLGTKAHAVGTQVELLKQFLAYLTGNIEEFKELGIFHEEWSLDRLSEAKGLIEVFVKRTSSLEEVLLFDGVASEFNRKYVASEFTLECGQIIELKIS